MSQSPPRSEPSPDQAYPGQRLGRPETGSGSVARWGRRILALLVDWLASLLIASPVVGVPVWAPVTGQHAGASTLDGVAILVFFVEAALLTAMLGGSFGQLATRIHVARLDGRRATLFQSLLRTFLICLVVPPLIYNRDQRGLHDLAAGTVALVR